jgi:hypothetical protein
MKMPVKYPRDTVIEYVSKAFEKEVALIAKFEALKFSKGRMETITMHPTRPIPMHRIHGRDNLASVGAEALAHVKKNMAEIQELIDLLENNETESEARFRKLIEELNLCL